MELGPPPCLSALETSVVKWDGVGGQPELLGRAGLLARSAPGLAAADAYGAETLEPSEGWYVPVPSGGRGQLDPPHIAVV